MSSHEPVQAHSKAIMGSNRSLGFVFAGVFTVVAVWPLIRHEEPVRWWALAFALTFLGLALFAEQKLAPLNRLWFKLGLAMHAIMSPLIMGLLFFCAVAPIGGRGLRFVSRFVILSAVCGLGFCAYEGHPLRRCSLPSRDML